MIKKIGKRSIALAFFFLILFLASLPSAYSQKKTLILATTTSIQDSGLLDVLIPLFEKKTGYFVKPIAVGSGQAIALGRRGEADVLLVHSPDAERDFVANGYGVNRRIVMYNYFLVLGPAEDPARIRGAKSAADSFARIARKGSLFISRGDGSGTHSKEMEIWKAAGVDPHGKKWYQQTGLGMGQTLNIASEKKGYVLSDRGTFLALRKNLRLNIMVEGDETLLNLYHVIEVSQSKWPKVNAAGARSFSDFMVSEEIQVIIERFGSDRYGQSLFLAVSRRNRERR